MPRGDYWPSVEERISAKIKSNGECREWTGITENTGVPRIGYKGKNFTVSRLVWELAFGPIPNGLHVLHHCDNPKCSRTTHLFLGTHQDNMNDMNQKKRRYLSTGGINPNAKLNHEKVLQLRSLWKSGEKTMDELEKLFNMDRSALYKAIKGTRWGNI